MKKILLIITVLMSIQITAQETYLSMLDSNVVWYQVTVDGGFPQPVFYNHNYFIDGDTIINDTSFYKLYLNYEGSSEIENSGYIRQDSTGKVFIRFSTFISLCPFGDADFPLNMDLLLMDFGVNLNDTLYAPFGWNDEDAKILISEVDSIMINGTYRKRIWFGSYGDGSFREGTWIEGIGGDVGGLFNYWCNIGFGSGTDLLCYVRNDEIVYSPGNNCIVGVEEIDAINLNLKIYPNPASESVNISVSENIKVEKMRVYELTGRVILQQPIFENNMQLDVSNLMSGMYLLEVETDEGLRQVKRVVIEN